MKHLLKKHRMLSVGIFLAAVLSIIYAAILSPAGKSTGSFSEFCTTLFREEMKSNTMNLHFTLKDPKAAGIDSYEITLGSLSGDSPHNQARQLKKLSEELKKYSHRSLKGKDRLTCRLLSDYISRQQNLAAYPYYDEPLTPSGGVTSQLPVLLAEYTFRNTRDIKDYLGLLSQMDTYFLGILDYEQKKADAGLFMSDEACLKVIEGCEVFTEHPDDNFLIDTFSNRLNAMDGLTDTQKNAYLKQHPKVLSDHVIPAYSSKDLPCCWDGDITTGGFVTSRKEKPITRRSCLQIRAVMTAWKICFPRLPKPGGKISRSVRIFWKKIRNLLPSPRNPMLP